LFFAAFAVTEEFLPRVRRALMVLPVRCEERFDEFVGV
jgi:hypothetical protein